MDKYTTEQLKTAIVELRDRDADAFEMVFDELHRRMGDEKFDAFCEQQGW